MDVNVNSKHGRNRRGKKKEGGPESGEKKNGGADPVDEKHFAVDEMHHLHHLGLPNNTAQSPDISTESSPDSTTLLANHTMPKATRWQRQSSTGVTPAHPIIDEIHSNH
eukprot:scaffold19567_cov153-Skeletonema_marinoi.AAC.1